MNPKTKGTQSGITGRNAVDNDPEAVNVHHLGERDVFFTHFAVNAVQVFLTALDLGFDVKGQQMLAKGPEHLAHHIAMITTRSLHCFV